MTNGKTISDSSEPRERMATMRLHGVLILRAVPLQERARQTKTEAGRPIVVGSQ
jgi:hypothetical protein